MLDTLKCSEMSRAQAISLCPSKGPRFGTAPILTDEAEEERLRARRLSNMTRRRLLRGREASP